VDLNEDPVFVLGCGHVVTMASLDGLMNISEHYDCDEDGKPTSIKGELKPFDVKSTQCINCRGTIQNVKRYSRISKRALIDESTKKFIAWSNNAFAPLCQRLDKIEDQLNDRETVSSRQLRYTLDATRNNIYVFSISGIADDMISKLSAIRPLSVRWFQLLQLRRAISTYRAKVTEGEQPFGRINDMMESISIQRGHNRSSNTHAYHEYHEVLQVKPRLMATSLSLRCDILILNDFSELRRLHANSFSAKHDWRAVDVNLDASKMRELCMDLAIEAKTRMYPMIQVEAYIHFAHLVALERSLHTDSANETQSLEDKLTRARELLDMAKGICEAHPGSTAGMLKEVEAAEKRVRGDTFYEVVTNEEKRQIIQAMRTEFDVRGHWYVRSLRGFLVSADHLTLFVPGTAVPMDIRLRLASVGGRCRRRGVLSVVRRLEDEVIDWRRGIQLLRIW
jgi:hypothetical protein